MIKYVLKRILMLIPILIGVSIVVFTILNIVPGDPARVILGDSATAEDVAELNHKLGYDRPFMTRYVSYIGGIVTRLDFGESYKSGQSVIKEVSSRVPTSVNMSVLAVVISVLLGVPLGISSAVRQYSTMDSISRVFSIFIGSVPIFWLGMIFIFFFSLRLGILPSSGLATWKGYILPALALGLPNAGILLRFTRSAMLETIRKEYVKTAMAKGVPDSMVILHHSFKNALLPIITVIGTSFGGLLGGAVITESVFSLPGLGTLLVTAIRTKDVPLVMGATLFYALIFSVIMLTVDLLYAAVDPRIKAKYQR